jgi:crotonobetainyl-CoA:carnitine CoA-transferase CaiB-like acyl-CoA transferase
MGPLKSLKIAEFAGIGPGPMAAMALADLGATVLRLDRVEPSGLGIGKPPRFDILLRGRKRVALDLKTPEGTALALELIERADAVIEGFRPGVMERLGLGPDICFAHNPRLVYGRMTGWGQTGPLAQSAAHDINCIAISGALDAIARRGAAPTPPLNLVGDYSAAIYLAFGMVSAILSSRETGQGQVVDASIAEAAAHLMTHAFGMAAAGLSSGERGTNLLDGGVPYYDSYLCKDGKYVSIGAIEGKFFNELLTRIGFDPKTFPPQRDASRHDEMRQAFACKFLEKSRDEWCLIHEGSDSCFAPVLSVTEAAEHQQYAARAFFREIDGIVQPGPVPAFSLTVPQTPSPPQTDPYANAAEALGGWLPADRIKQFYRSA